MRGIHYTLHGGIDATDWPLTTEQGTQQASDPLHTAHNVYNSHAHIYLPAGSEQLLSLLQLAAQQHTHALMRQLHTL